MLPYDQARRIVLEHARVLGAEQVPLMRADGRILAEEIHADRDFPQCDLATMDGFACRAVDRGMPLALIETIPAGQWPAKAIGPGQCARIMTGAPLPLGADSVVPVEYATTDSRTVRLRNSESMPNIRRRGQELHKGDKVLEPGTAITPPVAAVLAAVGCEPVSVRRRPRVSAIVTGTELVEPAETPAAAQIRNSNSTQLCAQVARAGAEPSYGGIVHDSPEGTREAIQKASLGSDVVLLSGGVSMGDYDFVPGVLADMGVDLLFEKVAIRPGKPTVFGVKDDTYFFGLPGNPVSAFVTFEMLVRPLLSRLMEAEWELPRAGGRLAEAIDRAEADRLGLRPIRLDPNGAVHPIEYRGSAHIHAYVGADGMVAMPVGVTHLGKGEMVDVRLL
jgi:molybdopterin molybdotransferase